MSESLPTITLYDTLQRRKVTLVPSAPGHVGMYLCGPTVYSDAHAGHAKMGVAFDVVRRTLMHFGYAVRFVSNITDVGHLQGDADEGEDKLQARARLERLEPMEVADKYFWSYFDDMAALNVLRPSISPRATGHIPEQIALIEQLIERGHAYEAGGSVYFDVRSYPQYGRLSGRSLDEQAEGVREAVRGEKRDPRDFALWKRAEAGHLMRWSSPWGVGFPGWHIECSAMSLKYLGAGFDIHAGGLDLQFPHHEAEIAQAEAAGHAFARHWMHNNMLTVNGEKMSKSKGNFRTIGELLREFDPMVLRFLLVSSHYRSVTEFSEESFTGAANGYRRLTGALSRLAEVRNPGPERPEFARKVAHWRSEFEGALRDDFNTPEGVAALFGLAREVGTAGEALTDGDATLARETLLALGGGVLGLFAGGEDGGGDGGELLGRAMELVLEARQHYRLNKEYARADALRERLAEVGVSIEDGKDGTRWRR